MRAVSCVIRPNTAAGTRYMAQRTTTMLTSCTAPSRSTSGWASLPSMVTRATPTKIANTTTCSMFCSTLACSGLVGTMRTSCVGRVDSEGGADGRRRRRGGSRQLGHLQVAARLHRQRHHQTDQRRDHGGEQKEQAGAHAHAAQLLHVARTGHAQDDRRHHQRNHDHLHHGQKQVARHGQPVAHQLRRSAARASRRWGRWPCRWRCQPPWPPAPAATGGRARSRSGAGPGGRWRVRW